MQESNFIIAINKDADAPIMKAADVALVGDYSKILPALAEEIRRVKQA